jgi:Zn-dependent alcohol dehydrogenase
MDYLPARNIPTKALVVEKPGAPFVLQDVVLDEVRPNELLVEIKYAGICHTVREKQLKQRQNLA